MFKWLKSILLFILGLWNDLPKEDKERYIKRVVESFENILRQYYRKESRT